MTGRNLRATATGTPAYFDSAKFDIDTFGTAVTSLRNLGTERGLLAGGLFDSAKFDTAKFGGGGIVGQRAGDP